MTEQILYSYRSKEITLAKAIQNCSKLFTNGIALLYSPEYCKLAKIEVIEDKVNLIKADNKSIDLEYTSSHIFEARIFNEICELRWLNESNGTGKAVLITEQDLSNFFEEISEKTFLETLAQQYLLWGEIGTTKLTSGWQRLAAARIGSLDVPLEQPISKNQRVYLKTIEYLNTVDDYGNVAVIEERLVKLEVK